MESLKNQYDDWVFSSDECPDTDEYEANVADNTDEEVKHLEKVLTDKGIDGIREELCADLDKWKGIDFHIAVTGSSGAGKSAFINAIRDVNADAEGGAEVGVTETTKELKPYTHPKNPSFIVWDMPGIGTPNFPKVEYLTRVQFNRYDFFMILSKGRFTEEDLWLAEQIQEQNKRFYFIRTNIDVDINSDSRAYPNSHSAEKVITKVRNECRKNLVDAGIKEPLVFLVDNHDRKAYEFGKLENQLLQDADSLKVDAIALSLSALNKKVLQKKRDVLKGRIAGTAMEIACLFDKEHQQRLIFENEISVYKEQFNLDEETLNKNKDILRLSDENLKEFKSYFKDLSDKTALQLCRKLLSMPRRSILERLLKMLLMAFKGNEESREHSAAMLQFSCFALHQNLEAMFKMALKVYDLDTQKGFVQSLYNLK